MLPHVLHQSVEFVVRERGHSCFAAHSVTPALSTISAASRSHSHSQESLEQYFCPHRRHSDKSAGEHGRWHVGQAGNSSTVFVADISETVLSFCWQGLHRASN